MRLHHRIFNHMYGQLFRTRSYTVSCQFLVVNKKHYVKTLCQPKNMCPLRRLQSAYFFLYVITYSAGGLVLYVITGLSLVLLVEVYYVSGGRKGGMGCMGCEVFDCVFCSVFYPSYPLNIQSYYIVRAI